MPVCPQCDNRPFSNKEALLQHMKSSSAWHPFCSICDRRFVSQTAYDAVSLLETILRSVWQILKRLDFSIWRRNTRLPMIASHAIKVFMHLSPWRTIIVVHKFIPIASDVEEDFLMMLPEKRSAIVFFH